MALEDFPRCFLASQLLERSVDAGGSADGEGMWLGNRGITLPPAHQGGAWERRTREGSLGSAIVKEGCLDHM